MKMTFVKKRVFLIMLVIAIIIGTTNTLFADGSNPSMNFTNSGVTFNKEANLLRFNLKWSHPENDQITVMYSIDNGVTKKLGEYENQNDQVIAHIYLDKEDTGGSTLNLYAVDSNGNESEMISSEFQELTSSGITIEDSEVPLSVSKGTWSLINLFLAALSVAMLAVSLMLFIENRTIDGFRNGGKINSTIITILTFLLAGGNTFILLTTQNLKHEMVMFDNMTITMLIITVLSVITTMILAVRAFGVQTDKDLIRE